MSNKSLTLSLILVGATTIIGQTPAPEQKLIVKPVTDQSNISTPPMPQPSGMPKQISGGVLNGKAVSLPKPPYPPAARAVNAEGAVSVQVLIDEEGNVASANAISGHPLLRAAAVEAARRAKFSPTLLMGTPVKVSGVITYNFVGSVTTAGIGYEIAFAERSGSFTPYVFPKSLAARMPDEWTVEKSVLEGLSFEKTVPAESVKQIESPSVPAPAPAANSDEAIKKLLIEKYTVVADPAYQTGKLTPASIESLRRLQSDIRTKLAADQKSEWHFRVGISLGVLAAEISDVNKTSFNMAEIEQLTAAAPLGVPENVTFALTRFIEFCKTSDGSSEARQMLVVAAQGIKNLRI